MRCGAGILEFHFARAGGFILAASLLVGGTLLSTDYFLLRLAMIVGTLLIAATARNGKKRRSRRVKSGEVDESESLASRLRDKVDDAGDVAEFGEDDGDEDYYEEDEYDEDGYDEDVGSEEEEEEAGRDSSRFPEHAGCALGIRSAIHCDHSTEAKDDPPESAGGVTYSQGFGP